MTNMTIPTEPDEFMAVNHAPVSIGRHVVIGRGSVVLQGAVLEDGVAIGAARFASVGASCSNSRSSS